MFIADVGGSNVVAGQYPQEAPEGENAAYAFAAAPFGRGMVGLSQTLDSLLAPNTKYTLQVEVGNPSAPEPLTAEFAGFPGYRVELLAGDTVLAADHNSLCIQDGTFETATVTLEKNNYTKSGYSTPFFVYFSFSPRRRTWFV